MALSLWDQYSDLHHYFNPEMFSFQHQAAGNHDEDDLDSYFNLFSFSNNGFDFSYDYVSDNQFPSFLNADNQSYYSHSDDFVFPFEDVDCNQNYPKRLKSCYHGDGSEFFSRCVPNVTNPPPPLPLPEFLPEIPAPPLAGFSLGKSSCCSSSSTDPESTTKKANNVSLSAQSIAARERRRKITEKTQELGKLIPGGHRMNTAEMFQAASKYVKFLQAQVKVLQLMEPIMQQEREELLPSQELQTLLASPIIQEKLYSEEKCLVPREILQTLKKDPEIQSKPTIFESIDQLISGD